MGPWCSVTNETTDVNETIMILSNDTDHTMEMTCAVIFLIWIIAGNIHAILHICHYPNCCVYHPDLEKEKESNINNHHTIPILHHYYHIFCRYIFNSLAILILIPSFIIMSIIWLFGRFYYLKCPFNYNTEIDNEQTNPNYAKKRIAVIGAGPSGLVTAKYLLDYGHDVILFEKSAVVGGSFAWSYSGLLTTSNFITQFSDLEINESDLMDKDYEIKKQRIKCGAFLTFEEYCNYLKRYAQVFHVFKCIQFNTPVVDMTYNKTNEKWTLCTSNDTNNNQEWIFDNVCIATGIACKPKIPHNLMNVNVPTDNNINIFHSNTFTSENDARIQNKNVLIIGCGESGSDIALIVSKVCQKYNKTCYLSTRNGPGYLIPRYFGGIPSDCDTSRMYHLTGKKWGFSPPIQFKRWLENFWKTPYDNVNVLNKSSKINKSMGISPFQKYGTKSVNFIRAILYYALINKPHIKNINFEKKEIQFIDNTEMSKCDVIICCTGYETEFTFLKNEIKEKFCVSQLYEKMFHLNYGSSLVFIGLNRPFIGSLPPVSELSARYYSLVVSSLRTLPPTKDMINSIDLENKMSREQFAGVYENVPALCDFISKSDSLSNLIGCNINKHMFKLFIYHPVLWYNTLTKTLQSKQFKILNCNSQYNNKNQNNLQLINKVLSKPPTIPFPVLLIEFFVYITYCSIHRT